MSAHRLTRAKRFPRPSLLLAAVGVLPLVWSCESEQTGFDVSIPLLGPMEFDEQTCEISGDVCSSDDDCVDEDGFFVGPCTKTMEVLEPLTEDVSLSPNSPSYTLREPDTSRWVAPFAVQQSGRGFPVDMTMENFLLQGGPVNISVRVFSRIGLVLGRDADYVPTTPASCTFTLDDQSTGADYANGINTCLRDWIDENGAPLEFDMEVSSSAGAAPAAAALKSDVAPKQDGYLVEGEWTQLTSEEECESDYTEDVLEAIEEGNDFFGLLSCIDLQFEGSGTTDQDITISGGSTVWDRCGNFLAAGFLLQSGLSAGTYTITVYEEEEVLEVDQDVPAVFVPGPSEFVEALLSAAAGRCVSGVPTRDSGYAAAWWDHCGPAPPPTRTGNIQFAAQGFCQVDQGSGATGGSNGQ